MNSIETTSLDPSAPASGFTLGTEVTFKGLTIVPVFGEPRAASGNPGTSSSAPDYDTLDAALARGTLHITEVTESGRVSEIKIANVGRRPVLIVDGEELVGAKQNRTVNLSMLIPPAADVIVPVTCVEAGRWSDRSRKFSSSSRTHFAAGRAAKSAQVSESLRRHGVARADQGRVWEQIALMSERLQASSPTDAMAEMFEVKHEAVESFVNAFRVAEGQIGAVFILNGEAKGVDLFDSPETFRSLIPKILRGYALDAIDLNSKRASHTPSSTDVAAKATLAKQFMQQVLNAPRTPFAAPGLGETRRLYAPQVSGGELTVNGSLVHLSAFGRETASDAGFVA
jgi:hypothetical protein